MPESNPLRNSRLETHPDDERGALAWQPPSDVKISGCLENSSSNAPRSGILVIAFKLGGRQITERRMQQVSGVGLFEELADRRASLSQVPVFVAQHLFWGGHLANETPLHWR